MRCLPSTVYRLPQSQKLSSAWRKSVVGSRRTLSKGLTLVEILVAMGIATVAGVMLAGFIVISAGLFTKQSSKVQQGLSSNDALAGIRMNIKQASMVAAGYTDSQTSYTTGVNQLVLKVASYDLANNILPDTYDFFVFFLDQNFLRFKVFPDPASSRKAVDQVLVTSVDSLYFQYFNSGTPPQEVTPADAVKVRVSLTLKQGSGAGIETNTAVSEANLRND